MEKLRYRDFIVQLGIRPGGLLHLRVLRSPAGEGESLQPLPDWLEAGAPAMAAGGESTRNVARRRAESPSKARGEYGARLHEMLFAGQVGRLWDQSLGAIRGDAGAGLRLRLQFDLSTAARLAELPWELLFRSDTGTYLSLDRQTPIFRHLEVAQPVGPLPLPGGLKILAVAAAPRQLEALDLESEKKLLRQKGKKSRWQVSFLELPTVAELRRALVDQGAHVLHFMGHGGYDDQLQEGVLYFEDENGDPAPWTGEALAEKLADLPFLRLVVLNACQTAISGGDDPYGGVAAALVRGGLPAVVAMQRPISDAAAIAFAKSFYHQLANGAGLEVALTEGRQAIHTLDPTRGEWAIPVLFGRATTLGLGEDEDEGVPALFHWAFGLVLLVLLGLMFAPPPARTEVQLELQTDYLRFRLPDEDQRVFDRLILGELGATDLKQVELGEPVPAASRYDLLLAGEDAERSSITVQQSRVPGRSWIALARQDDGRYGLAIETERGFAAAGGFEALAAGPYRALLRPQGAKPQSFAGASAAPALLRFAPRGRQVRWDLAFRRFAGNEFRSPIPVVGLELFEVEEGAGELDGRAATRLEAKFDLSGQVTVAGAGKTELPAGSQLRLDEPRGVLQQIRPGEDGIAMVFSGSVADLWHGAKGQQKSLKPSRAPHFEILNQVSTVLACVIALIELAGFARPHWRSLRLRRAAAAKKRS